MYHFITEDALYAVENARISELFHDGSPSEIDRTPCSVIVPPRPGRSAFVTLHDAALRNAHLVTAEIISVIDGRTIRTRPTQED